jgi:endo-1,4-beta-D-glucanase Y
MISIYLKGTGTFLAQGITLDSKYGDTCLDEIDAWFDAYYVESSDSRYGRIKWLDDNHSDPLVTVSEGMGYGIKLAVIASGLGDSEVYQKRVDRLLAFWNNNLDANGLMDWQVSGFGHTVVGAGSATDADLAMAFALICAYEKFCDPKYLTSARVVINEIWSHDLYTTTGGKILLAPGDSWHDYFNPSYFIPAALLSFKIYDTAHNWATVYTDNLALLIANQTAHACYGLPSDWCSEDGTPVIGLGSIVAFGYEACRVIDNIASGYNIYYEPALLSYLQTIASNTTLLSHALGSNPVVDLSLRITPTAWGTENNSLGLISILPAFELCSTMTQGEIQSLVDMCFVLSDERTDYFKQVYKCVILSVMTNKCNRYATDLGAVAKHGYIIDLEPPEAASGAKRMQLLINDSEEDFVINPEDETKADFVEFSASSADISAWNSATSTLSPEKEVFYIGTALTAFNLSLPSDAAKSDCFEFSLSIASDATVANFVFTGVTGWGTSAPTLVAGSTYEFSIRNGVCVWGLVVAV